MDLLGLKCIKCKKGSYVELDGKYVCCSRCDYKTKRQSESKFNLLNALLEVDIRTMAQTELDNMGDKTDRMKQARMSAAQLQQEKQKEIRKQASSTDPIDRQIYSLRQRIAQLRAQKKQRSRNQQN